MNSALPDMFAGNAASPTVLERQQARLKWKHEQFQQQQESFLAGGDLGDLFAVPTNPSQVGQFQGFAAGDSVKPNPGLENGWSDFAKFDMGSIGFNVPSVGYGNTGSGSGMNHASSRTSSCPPVVVAASASEAAKGKESVISEKLSSVAGKESFKKRKHEKAPIPKVDGGRDKKLKGVAEEESSKITDQNSNKSTTNKKSRETSADNSKDDSKASEARKPDYIHVRARRGQATDSHSLAERVRREKISERMRYLQDLVPGCNKITGKAGMLDEIINYVQSLQRQVEFLSMKLATVGSRINFNIDSSFAEGLFSPCTPSFPTIGMSMEIANSSYLQLNPVQEAVLGCGLEMGVNPSEIGLRRSISAPVSLPETFLDMSSFNQIQPSPDWGADLQSLYNAESQARLASFASQSQAFTGMGEASNLKMEI